MQVEGSTQREKVRVRFVGEGDLDARPSSGRRQESQILFRPPAELILTPMGRPRGRPRGHPGVADADGVAAAVAANKSIQRDARDAEVSEKSAARAAFPGCGVPMKGTAGCFGTYREGPGVKVCLDQPFAAWSGVYCQPMGTQNGNLSLKEER
jgi:hypothetical protein